MRGLEEFLILNLVGSSGLKREPLLKETAHGVL